MQKQLKILKFVILQINTEAKSITKAQVHRILMRLRTNCKSLKIM